MGGKNSKSKTDSKENEQKSNDSKTQTESPKNLDSKQKQEDVQKTDQKAEIEEKKSSPSSSKEKSPNEKKVKKEVKGEVVENKNDAKIIKDEEGFFMRSIDVPKKMHAAIIGPKGATIKELRANTKAEFVLPESGSDSTEVKIRGRSESVVNAGYEGIRIIVSDREAEHQKTLDDHEANSQATNKVYAKYQTRIDECAANRTKYHEQADIEYNNGNKAEAAKLREMAKEQTKKMEELQREASNEIFNKLNKDYKDGLTIDLHGLHVETAIEFLGERIEKLKKEGKTNLLVIYGAGNHSDKNVGAKIKPACRKLFEEKGLKFMEINNGSVNLSL